MQKSSNMEKPALKGDANDSMDSESEKAFTGNSRIAGSMNNWVDDETSAWREALDCVSHPESNRFVALLPLRNSYSSDRYKNPDLPDLDNRINPIRPETERYQLPSHTTSRECEWPKVIIKKGGAIENLAHEPKPHHHIHGLIRVWRILDEESTMLVLNLCNSKRIHNNNNKNRISPNNNDN